MASYYNFIPNPCQAQAIEAAVKSQVRQEAQALLDHNLTGVRLILFMASSSKCDKTPAMAATAIPRAYFFPRGAKTAALNAAYAIAVGSE